MKIIVERRGRTEKHLTLAEFADLHGLTLKLTERSRNNPGSRWIAEFVGVEEMHNGMLRGTFGDGSTPTMAVVSYVTRITGCRLVKDATGPGRYEFDVPNSFKGIGADIPLE